MSDQELFEKADRDARCDATVTDRENARCDASGTRERIPWNLRIDRWFRPFSSTTEWFGVPCGALQGSKHGWSIEIVQGASSKM